MYSYKELTSARNSILSKRRSMCLDELLADVDSEHLLQIYNLELVRQGSLSFPIYHLHEMADNPWIIQ